MPKRFREWREVIGGFAGSHREYRVIELQDGEPKPRRGKLVSDEAELHDWQPGEPEAEEE